MKVLQTASYVKCEVCESNVVQLAMLHVLWSADVEELDEDDYLIRAANPLLREGNNRHGFPEEQHELGNDFLDCCQSALHPHYANDEDHAEIWFREAVALLTREETGFIAEGNQGQAQRFQLTSKVAHERPAALRSPALGAVPWSAGTRATSG